MNVYCIVVLVTSRWRRTWKCVRFAKLLDEWSSAFCTDDRCLGPTQITAGPRGP